MRCLYKYCLLCFSFLVAGGAHSAKDVFSIEQQCYAIANKLSSVNLADCEKRSFITSGGYSVLRQPLLVEVYPPLDGRTPKGRVMLIGGVHGDEYSSVSVVFKWMQTLDKYHSGLFHWRFIPLLNPDGLLRKKSQRMNENGVDLNRNFPTPNWKEESEYYWVKRTGRNLRRYPGRSALSEPESQWLVDEIERFKPDVIISVHAPYGVLDYDGPPKPPKKLGQLHLNLLGTYPGSLGNYAGVQRKIPVVTIELPHSGIMPTKAQVSHIWRDLVRWLRRNVPLQVKQRQLAQADPS